MTFVRIAIAGFQHETNTFAPTLATYDDFLKKDAWPELLLGDAVFHRMRGMNIPIAGFFEEAGRTRDWELVPVLWCSAEPSSYVTDDAFERIAKMILDGFCRAGALDGIYMDLHGAMVVQSFEDGEGELLRRVRGLVGPDMPIVVSLDLHANITRAMCEYCTAMTVFRTYPHVDMAEAGSRAVAPLAHALAGKPVYTAWRQSPFLVGLTAQHTGSAPCDSLYEKVSAVEADGLIGAELSMGFPAADIHDSGPAIVACGETREVADRIADEIFRAVLDAEPGFDDRLISPDEAVRRAMAGAPNTIVIADAQDNAGAGASSDTTGVLSALVRAGARNAVLALLNDPDAAASAHAAGVGANVRLSLGGKSGQPGQTPFDGEFTVEALADGNVLFSGEMYGGFEGALGPMAVLRVVDDGADVRVVVGSHRCQCLDQEIFRHVGIEPSEQQIVVVKSTVHFRADFEPIADDILVAEAPGAHPCRLDIVDFRNLRDGVRLGACGPVFRRRA